MAVDELVQVQVQTVLPTDAAPASVANGLERRYASTTDTLICTRRKISGLGLEAEKMRRRDLVCEQRIVGEVWLIAKKERARERVNTEWKSTDSDRTVVGGRGEAGETQAGNMQMGVGRGRGRQKRDLMISGRR